MSLHGFLTRLILLCIAPLVLLGAYLTFDQVRTLGVARDTEAAQRARNFATSVDQFLNSRIAALQILAASPLAGDTRRWRELYQEARGFRRSFGSDVILADQDLQVVFNTRLPFASAQSALPRPTGRSAAAVALQTGKPAVGDIFVGPVARENMVAIAVPGLRAGQAAFLLLTPLETRLFQQRIEKVALPDGWMLALLDGKGATIARTPAAGRAEASEAMGQFVASSELAPWTVVLEIPRDIYRAPLVEASVALAVALLGATLIGVVGGMLASRRLARSLASLGQPSATRVPDIAEIAALRRLLDESARCRDSAEAERRASELRFRATFEQAAVGIALRSPDGHWLRANPRLCSIVGYSQEELLDKTFHEITHADDLPAEIAYVRRMLAGEIDSCSMEKRYLRKGGLPVWTNVTVALVRKADTTPDYFIAIVEDIEARKQAEEEIRDLNASLEQHVEKRTAELIATNKELDTFAYAVSHDLRAPLRALNGFSQALVEDYGGRLEGEAKNYLEQIVIASRKMGELIDGMLALSRSTRGQLRHDTVDLSALAAQVFADLAKSYPERAVALDIEPGLTVEGDAQMLEAVMLNLLGNAWKYTGKTAAPAIRVYSGEIDGRRAICVADNGAGFDMAYAAQLFQPFRRLHRQDEFPGIGIGLATAQRIIRRHGGEIHVTAAPGAGATFCFTIADAANDAPAARPC
jgi:PAS domain S-box-containing protein